MYGGEDIYCVSASSRHTCGAPLCQSILKIIISTVNSDLSWVTATLMEEGLCLREGASGQVDEGRLQLHLIHILQTNTHTHTHTHTHTQSGNPDTP